MLCKSCLSTVSLNRLVFFFAEELGVGMVARLEMIMEACEFLPFFLTLFLLRLEQRNWEDSGPIL